MTIRISKAFCPAHITCFFQVCDKSKNPLEIGSRGAGICLNKGVTTTVKVETAKSNKLKIIINPDLGDPKVTRDTAEKMMRIANEKNSKCYRVTLVQDVGIPVYAGFGSSGAAAFSTALALNEAFKLGLTKNKVGQIAHLSEVENLTGLGDVIAQSIGGVEIRVKEGAPGYGLVDNVPVSEDYLVVCGSIGGLETKNVLSQKEIKEKINRAGETMVEELLKNATLEEMVRLAKRFMREVNLAPKEILDAILMLEKNGFENCSMIMLGKSLFCVTTRKDAKKAYKILLKCMPKSFVEIFEIDLKGVRLM